MSSRSQLTLRQRPSQARGRQRVAGLLEAAQAVIAERGAADTTMSAIAERAGAAIGSLYQFYPNKDAVIEALRALYTETLEPRWAELTRGARRMSAGEIASGLARLAREGLRACPAWAELVKAPPTEGSHQHRDLLRRRLKAVLRTHQPRMAAAEAEKCAAVTQHLLCGLFTLPGETAELEQLLSIYLQIRFQEQH